MPGLLLVAAAGGEAGEGVGGLEAAGSGRELPPRPWPVRQCSAHARAVLVVAFVDGQVAQGAEDERSVRIDRRCVRCTPRW
ncbi:hypothetical protein [Kitasatospora purpeofusca]|uniref:Secreted protein n=1 Tax=Kitasatospora purpeofusca TaxID=67352 RepID=A0ABZ1UE43_9ACTN|nr:hypothetical protein [Kitasatospora purpeofusca]